MRQEYNRNLIYRFLYPFIGFYRFVGTDWYAVVNMAVATMYDYASTAEDYSDFALGFFKDPSAKQGKAYNYYTHIVK